MRYGALLTLLLFAVSVQAQVTSDNILNASHEPQNWLTYSGGYASQRYSLLDKINRDNVKDLQLKWVYRPAPLASVGPEGGPPDKMEATPLVVNGIMYTVQGNDVVALDAASGRIFWTFTYEIPPESNAYVLVCKGLAISGNTVFWATYDGHLIAIDATSGKAIWNKTLVDWHKGYQLNVAPLIIKNMVVLGTADNERGANCWVGGYDVKSGKELWRFWTAPNSPTEAIAKTWGGDSYKYGGSPIWVTGSYDPETNLTFWGTGDPNPGWNGDSRPGDNLYADSVLALDAETGKLKWYYQFMPHDEFDLDSLQVPVLADIQWKGEPRKVMLWANRNGFFYVFDRTNGQFLMGKAFVKQNWNLGFDAKGRPIMAPGLVPKPEGAAFVLPGTQGGTNWYSPSFSPRTGFFYISTWDDYSNYSPKSDPGPWVQNKRYMGASSSISTAQKQRSVPPIFRTEEEGYGAVRAIDPQTGEKKWDFKMVNYTESGVLSTASDLVFSGGMEGNFFALDARDGRCLWKVGLGGTVASGPITYSVDGHQYVAVAAKGALFAFALPE
jgi:alcohol dehydrogenase (cytochrome c)